VAHPPRAAHRISFVSRPSGAAVRIDGRLVGSTPLRLELEPSDRPLEVTFSRKGCRLARRLVTVDRAREVRVSLEPRPRRKPGPGRVDWVDPF